MIRKVSFVHWLFLWLAFSSLVIAALFNVLGTSFNLLILKDIATAMVLVGLLVTSTTKDLNPLLIILPFVFYLILLLPLSDAPGFAQLASLRQMLNPFLFITIGFLAVHNQEDHDRLIRYMVAVLKFVLILGLLELNLWSLELYRYSSLL